MKVSWHERRGREKRPLLGKRELQRQIRVRRTGKGEYRLTMNSQNGCPLLRDSVDLAGGGGKRREILAAILSGTFLTDSRRSPIHPATHMPTITYTHIHPHTDTPSQCELFGFKCGLHHFFLIPDMISENRFIQIYLKIIFLYLASYPCVVQTQIFFLLATCCIMSSDPTVAQSGERVCKDGARSRFFTLI